MIWRSALSCIEGYSYLRAQRNKAEHMKKDPDVFVLKPGMRQVEVTPDHVHGNTFVEQ